MRFAVPLLALLPLACHEAAAPPTVELAQDDAAAGPVAVELDAGSTPSTHPTNGGRLAVADDPNASVDARCSDAFAAFRTRIHPGDTAAQVGAVLGTPTWIGSDLPVNAVGGFIPVTWSFDDQVVVFMCLPKPNPQTQNLPWSPWVIYARLEGRASSTFGAFLGKGGSAKLLEYALCHTKDGHSSDCDRFPKK